VSPKYCVIIKFGGILGSIVLTRSYKHVDESI